MLPRVIRSRGLAAARSAWVDSKRPFTPPRGRPPARSVRSLGRSMREATQAHAPPAAAVAAAAAAASAAAAVAVAAPPAAVPAEAQPTNATPSDAALAAAPAQSPTGAPPERAPPPARERGIAGRALLRAEQLLEAAAGGAGST